MSKCRVVINYWSEDYEAEDEGDALMQAERDFSLISEARVIWEEGEDE